MSLPIEMERRIANLKITRFIDNLTDPEGVDINAVIAFCKGVLNTAGFVVSGEYNDQLINKKLFVRYNNLLETIFVIDDDTPLESSKHPHIKEQIEFCTVLLEDLGFKVADVIGNYTPKIPVQVIGSGGGGTDPRSLVTTLGAGIGSAIVASTGTVNFTPTETLKYDVRMNLDDLLYMSKDEMRAMAIREIANKIIYEMIGDFPKYFKFDEAEDNLHHIMKYRATLKVCPP